MTRTTRIQVRALFGFFFGGVLTVAGTSALRAQSTAYDARWQAWLGCWQPVEARLTGPSPYVCVIPGSGSSSVSVVTISNGKEISRQRIEATGQQRPITEDGCSGWESAKWSADSRRIYTQSEVTCPGALRRTSSGILAFSGTGEWLDVQLVRAGDGSGLAVARYRDAGIPAAIPAEISAALAGKQRAISAARMAAGAPIGTADVVDAARNTDSDAVNGWLVERGQALALDATQLAALSEAGVPGKVTDVMLALSYPDVLALDRGTGDGSPRETGGYRMPGRASEIYFGRYGYSPYGYSPYGYLGNGLVAGFGSYGSRYPYIIVTKGGAETTARGRAEKGRGYTRRGDSSGGGRTTSTRSRGSSGSSGTGSRPSSGSGGRTAKPRK
jgi:hypothetical protein